MVFVFLTSAFVSMFSMQCYADISVFNINGLQVDEIFRSVTSKFGPSIDPEGFEGFAIYANPPDGCTLIDSPPNNNTTDLHRWIAVIERGNCTFVEKVLNAQNSNYSMAIIHNNISNGELEKMQADETGSEVYIPSVFVSLHAGRAIKDKYQYKYHYYLVVEDPNFPFDINADLLIPFAVVVAVCFITMIGFMICKCIRDRRRARRHRLPASSLRKIPIEKFSKGSHYETCAICLDDYIEGEKLRILPCCHAYHTKCIDPWLTRNRRVCPICKRKVFAADESPIQGSDSDSDSDNDERTPLVRSETSQQRQPRRAYLLSPTPISRLFWQHREVSNDNGHSSGTSSSSNSFGNPEIRILPAAVINSINSTDSDSVSSGSVGSLTCTPGRNFIQLPLDSDNSEELSHQNVSVGSEAGNSQYSSEIHRVV